MREETALPGADDTPPIYGCSQPKLADVESCLQAVCRTQNRAGGEGAWRYWTGEGEAG